ncbi:1620_t:CDS:2, partial [Acaulospora morrowiae]
MSFREFILNLIPSVSNMRIEQVATCTRSNCNRPVYIEADGYAHPYCSKTCASIYKANVGKCSNARCRKLKYVEADGKVFDYCGRTCAQFQKKCARNGCNRSRYIEPSKRKNYYLFCSPACYWKGSDSLVSTKISTLSTNNLDYIRIQREFSSALPQATILGILLLQMPSNIVKAHDALKGNMATSGSALYKMYHGTKSVCDPVNLISRKEPICQSGCGVCGIIREGNKTSYSRSGVNQMWFGRSPAVSIGYTSGSNKAIFCVDVISPSPPANFIIVNSNPQPHRTTRDYIFVPQIPYIFSSHRLHHHQEKPFFNVIGERTRNGLVVLTYFHCHEIYRLNLEEDSFELISERVPMQGLLPDREYKGLDISEMDDFFSERESIREILANV